MSREAASLRKLQFDDGNIEDRRHINLAGSLRVLRNSETCSKSEADKALKQLDALEVFMKKQRLISHMCEQQSMEYEDMANRVDEEVSRSREKMNSAKLELSEARIVRKHRQDYDQVAKQIEEYPSRSDTKRKLQEVRDELTQQQERQQLLESKLSERRNHLHAFNIILSNFQNFLNDDDEEITGDEAKEEHEGSVGKEEIMEE